VANRLSVVVEFDLPEGATTDEVKAYVQGGLQHVHQTDPFFYFDRRSVKVMSIRLLPLNGEI